ncbi:calycin-like domain-containing protein [Bacteroides timonensis]|uniref:calycin-like domain-containing protein n=1 Tax=Bacteroides timonensis TaxID=1470345 RepID=UPI0004B2BFDC|nr:calycin-like domain-containing protein [Bacteroides timonensis]
MKRSIYLFVMLFACVLTVFAANIKSSYSGTLDINVDGTISSSTKTVSVTDNGNGTITARIRNFSYSIFSGTVTITATIDANGVLSNPSVSFSGISISSVSMNNSYITQDACEIHLVMTAIGDAITVDFSGQ